MREIPENYLSYPDMLLGLLLRIIDNLIPNILHNHLKIHFSSTAELSSISTDRYYCAISRNIVFRFPSKFSIGSNPQCR